MANREKSNLLNSSQPMIHRGPWLITGLSSAGPGIQLGIIADGALVVADGLIKAVGTYRDIAREFGQYHIQEHEGRVLAPALINSHCHLELSHLDCLNSSPINKNYNGNPIDWIKDLLAERELFFNNRADAEELILNHARKTLHQMTAEGVIFVGDVGNSLVSRMIGHGQRTRVAFLLELLGLTKESETKTFVRLENIAADASLEIGCTPHAPYSTSPSLIQAMKKLAGSHGQIFSIHVAESAQEVEFMQTGSGVFREFLLERGAWDGSFRIPGKGSVQYLDGLGVIDSNTLCVHAVHVDHAEIQILAKNKAKVCLCPGSNRFIGVGKAPVTEFLAHGILPALGTDSKASNEALSMWREMRLLREDHPGLPPESVFAMATRGGAEAWGIASEMGSLEAGKRALVMKVSCNEHMRSAQEIFEYLTTAGESVQVDLLEQI
jgi:cytosine/adenosine deaminase-related metal-dependent hydrolase